MIARGAKQTVLAVLPGNPGDAVFYAEFVQALIEQGHEVTVASHLALPAAPASMVPYAAHQAESITGYLAGSGRSVEDVDLVLVGHSVGAYLAHLIVSRRLLPVARVFMLCPFLARPAWSGRLLLRAVTSRRLLAAGLRCWRALPKWLQRRLIAVAGAGAHGEWVREALAAEQPRAWAAMASAEAREIASRRDATYLLEEPLFQDGRFVALGCRGDRWATPGTPGLRLVEGLSHAFVIDPEQCRTVARLIHAQL
jgi:pimeloyl-ACP methyl ester carboxylesterase